MMTRPEPIAPQILCRPASPPWRKCAALSGKSPGRAATRRGVLVEPIASDTGPDTGKRDRFQRTGIGAGVKSRRSDAATSH